MASLPLFTHSTDHPGLLYGVEGSGHDITAALDTDPGIPPLPCGVPEVGHLR